MEVVFIRHGDYRKPVDQLNELGIVQMQELRKYLFESGFIPTFGVCKPNNRSEQSALTVLSGFGSIELDNTLSYPANVPQPILAKLDQAHNNGESLRAMIYGFQNLGRSNFSTSTSSSYDMLQLFCRLKRDKPNQKGIIVSNEYITAGFLAYIHKQIDPLEQLRFVNWYQHTLESEKNKTKLMCKVSISGEIIVIESDFGRVQLYLQDLLNDVTNDIV
jgi:hypothetical protein